MVRKLFFEAQGLRYNSIAHIKNRKSHNLHIKLQLIFLFATIMLLLVSNNIQAQTNSQPLKLEDAIQAAITKNRQVILASVDEKISLSNYKQTEAIYLPQVGLSYTSLNSNNPLNAFGFKLQQRSISQSDFNPDFLNNPSTTSDFSTMLELQQPIINMDMLYKRKAAAKQTELYQFKTQRTKEALTFEVEKAYLQLQMAYDAVTVLEDALKTTNAVYTFTNNYYKQGLIQKSDLLNAKLRVTTIETNIAKAKSNIQNASDYIGLLMGAEGTVIYTVENTKQSEKSVAENISQIPSQRADFSAMQKAIEATDLMIISSKKSYLPKLNAFGNFQLNDSHILGFGANSWMVGVRLSWDIFKGNKTKNTIITQTLERDKLKEQLVQQKEQSQLDLNKAYRDLTDAEFDMKQQKVAIEQAAEALQILQNRYQQGLVNTTDVLMATTQLAQQKFSLLQAQYAANTTNAYIQFLTSTDKK